MKNLVLRRWGTVAVATLALSGCSYDQLSTDEMLVKEEWAQVEGDLQPRSQLMAQVAEGVKANLPQEQAVFQAVSEAEARLAAAGTLRETIAAAGDQTIALNRLRSVIQSHPELKADGSFNRSLDQLDDADLRVSVGRMRYNARVQQYNSKRRAFPTGVTALVFGFEEYPFFMVPSMRPEDTLTTPDDRPLF